MQTLLRNRAASSDAPMSATSQEQSGFMKYSLVAQCRLGKWGRSAPDEQGGRLQSHTHLISASRLLGILFGAGFESRVYQNERLKPES